MAKENTSSHGKSGRRRYTKEFREEASARQQRLLLAFAEEDRGESPMASAEGIVSLAADSSTESPTSDDRLMESICDSLNLERAVGKVIANDGAPGVDGMRVTQLEKYFERHRDRLIGELLSGTYRPQPVKRVEIPKPDGPQGNGGVRKLGIPTAVDRVAQQAILLVLSPQWDETFSANSFGFRPHRSAHDAVARAQSYLEDGYKWVVDRCERIVRPGIEGRLTPMMHRRVIRRNRPCRDLEKFFDRVNHDVLMSRVARRVKGKRLLKLIRAFLNSGVLIDGLFSGTPEGTRAPTAGWSGGPLSPLLSNLLLDDLDRELESRGLRFARYADDCNIYVKSRRAGERVLRSVST